MQAKLRGVTLDCPEPKGLSDFYHQLTGLKVAMSDDSFAALESDDGLWISFQRVENFRAPQWPGQDVPQQFHLDFGVPDLTAGEARVVELGGSAASEQPGGDRWRVMLDPAGHPFCLSLAN